jgi:cytochrome c-type biogenesis protein CcmH
MLWIIFALMSTAAILALLWPLARKPRAGGGSDLAVYQDQLQEIGRDRSAGLIGEAEAEAARVEVSRRLLAAADARQPEVLKQPLWHRRAAAITTLIVLLFLPISLYAKYGAPNIPDAPAYARTGLPPNHKSIMAMVAQVEQHLAQDPNDGAGWQVIAPVYMQLGRFDEAAIAFRKSLALNGETAACDSGLGEALVAAASGMVTDEAKQFFERAIARDPNDVRARYFLGLADEQDGNKEAAAAKWRALLKGAPANAPWVGFVRQALARVGAAPVAGAGPTARQIQAAQSMPAAQRIAAIRGMVAKLAGELQANGGNLDGWLRLVRAYAVLGEPDKAKRAAADAKRALAAHPDEIKRIDDLVKGLGLEG